MQSAFQVDQNAESGSDATGFQLLIMPAAEVHLLGDFLLGQASGFTQTREIATESEQVGLGE